MSCRIRVPDSGQPSGEVNFKCKPWVMVIVVSRDYFRTAERELDHSSGLAHRELYPRYRIKNEKNYRKSIVLKCATKRFEQSGWLLIE